MSQISKHGATLVRQNVERPLRVVWEEIEKAGLSEKCKDAYSHIFKFLDEIDDTWDKDVSGTSIPDPEVRINGKPYSPVGE